MIVQRLKTENNNNKKRHTKYDEHQTATNVGS